MSEEQIKHILGSINYEVETDKNWVEPVGLDRDTWKALLKYIQQKENIIKEVREYIEDNRLYMSNGNVLSLANTGCGQKLLEILDKGE